MLTVAALAAVAVGVELTLRQDRDELAQRFRTEQLEQAQALARTIETNLKDIREDLIFTSRMLAVTASNGGRTRTLEVLLRVVKHYRLAVAYGPDGSPSELAIDRATEPTFELTAVEPMLQQAVRSASGLSLGEVATVANPEASPTSWFRAFATPLPAGETGERRGTLVLVVDTALLFHKLKFSPGARPILLSAEGQVAPVTDPGFTAMLEQVTAAGAGLPHAGELVRRMRDGERGTLLIPEEEAARLGWEKADVVAAFARVPVLEETHWTVGVINSTFPLKLREHALHRRLAATSAAIIVCVLAFALWMIRSARRELAVRERLEHTEQVALLTSQLLQAEKLATVGMLAAGIAHEIGTPLGIVRARAELLANRLGPQSALTPGTLIIVDQIDRIARTLRQLLDFSQPRKADVTAVSMAASARKVVDLLHYEASKRKVELGVEVPADLPSLAANPDQLQQVLVNLVMNACDACDARTALGRVTIRATAQEAPVGQLRIEVADNGCGVPAELKHRVFDPFFTTKKRGKGTGLGLTVAAQIVRSHGGSIDLDSTPGEGTRVFVAWPIQRLPSEGNHGLTT